MLALAVALALGDLLPPRMGDYRLMMPQSGDKGVYSRNRPREATLLISREGGISCVSTPSVRATWRDVGRRHGCLFLATEIDPHVAPLVLAWSFRGFTTWLTLTKAGFDDDPVAAQARALRAAADAQRWMEGLLSRRRGRTASPAERDQPRP
jgi:hypothetical protein